MSSSTSCSAGLSRVKELSDERLIVADDQVVVDRFAPIGFASGEEPADVAVTARPVDAAMVIDRDVPRDAEHPSVETGFGPSEPFDGSNGPGHGLADRIVGVLVPDPTDEKGP